MAIIEWSPGLSVNIKTIDDQHKKLVDMVNTLHDSMKSGKAKDVMNSLVSELASYTDYHFKTEEEFFQKHKYPETTKHKMEHDALRKDVAALKGKLESGEAIVTVEVLYFLKDWLSKHIMGSDKKYTQHLNAAGVR